MISIIDHDNCTLDSLIYCIYWLQSARCPIQSASSARNLYWRRNRMQDDGSLSNSRVLLGDMPLSMPTNYLIGIRTSWNVVRAVIGRVIKEMTRDFSLSIYILIMQGYESINRNI